MTVIFSTRFFSLLPPTIPIQNPEVDSLAEVPIVDVEAAVQIGDGAGDLQDAVIGAGGKAETVHLISFGIIRLI